MTNEELYYLPASELLRHIQAEKERLIKEEVIRRTKPLPLITDEEKLYELPANWEWVRLGEVIEFSNGYAFKSKDFLDSGIGVIRIGDIVNGTIDETNMVFLESSIVETISKDYLVYPNDLLIAMSGATTGKIGINTTNKTFLLNQRVGKINPILVNQSFIKYLLELRTQEYLNMSLGSAIQNLSTDQIKNSIIPLPPLYIQDQIVQKLEQLSETKNSLLSHAESQLNYTKKMREALLQEAIRGKLVPQDENDEPASILLEKIKAEKERLIKEKVIKKSKQLPPITEEEKPYELPESWEWVRLGDVVDFLGGYAFKSNTYVKKSKYQVIRIGNVKNFNLMLNSNPIYVSQHIARENDRYKLYKNDILVTMTGTLGKRDYFFTTLINDNDVEYRELYLNQRVGCLRTYYDVTAKLLNYFLKTNLILNQVFLTETGTANQGNIGANAIKELVIPLPPLSEQDRIVAKLDELMAHCDQLELKAEEMKQSTIKLFEASLKEAFIPE